MAVIKTEKKYIRKTSETKLAGRPKKSIKEKKIYGYSFKFTEEENKIFQKKFGQSGKKDMTAFITHLLLYENLPIQTEDVSLQKLLPELNKLINEINAIGTNLNQMTKLAHQYSLAGLVPLDTMNRLLFEESKLRNFQESIQSIFYQIGQRWL